MLFLDSGFAIGPYAIVPLGKKIMFCPQIIKYYYIIDQESISDVCYAEILLYIKNVSAQGCSSSFKVDAYYE